VRQIRFLCACFLEYRSGKTDVWDNVEFFVDEILDNPDNLWQEIVHHTYEGWHERFFDYNLHPEQGIHDRLYRIATNMIRFYAGDGRQIWGGYEDDPDEIYKRLLLLQIPPSTACLIVGTLKDLGYVHGPFDIVGDIVDARVLGRMVCGDGTCISSLSARRLARCSPLMIPGDLIAPCISSAADGVVQDPGVGRVLSKRPVSMPLPRNLEFNQIQSSVRVFLAERAFKKPQTMADRGGDQYPMTRKIFSTYF
jgi:hypothetical protein